jgi:hypothetical protein
MLKLGYKLMAEVRGPTALVRDTVRAEQAGFAFAAISDHFPPWRDEQGHAPFAWSVLGAAVQATRQIELMTAVTCPIMRYHPAIAEPLAYNLGNFMRTLALPKGAELWSLTRLREKMIKIGARVVRHGRYVIFQMAEVAVSRPCSRKSYR